MLKKNIYLDPNFIGEDKHRFTKELVKICTSYKEDTRMGHIQCERLPKSKMVSGDKRFYVWNRACAVFGKRA